MSILRAPSLIRAALFSRIILVIAGAVFLASGAVGLSALSVSYSETRESHLERARLDAGTVFRAAINADLYPTVPQLQEYGRHITAVTPILGGVYLDKVGDTVVGFGESPELTWKAVKLDREVRRLSPDGTSIDFYFSASETKTAYGVILRVDLNSALVDLREEMIRQVVVLASMTLAATAAGTVLVVGVVIVPVTRLRRSITYTLDDPKNAVDYVTRFKGGDAVGLLGRALDRLFYLISSTFEEELANALATQAHLPAGLIVYSGADDVIDANEAALNFLGLNSPEDIALLDAHFLRIDDEILSPRQAIADGQFQKAGAVRVNADWVTCLIGGDAIRRPDGTIRRYFVTFADITTLTEEVRAAQAEAETIQGALEQQRGRTRALRDLLEACITLLDTQAKFERRKGTRMILPDRLVANWHQHAVAHRLMEPKSLRHGYLPALKVNPEAGEQLFSFALSAVRSRSLAEAPRILINARETGKGLARFTIAEINPDNQDEAQRTETNADAQLFLAAFAKTAPQCLAKIVSTTGPRGQNRLSFDIPIARGEVSELEKQLTDAA